MTDCSRIQARLAEEGVEAAAQAEIEQHLESCADCAAVLESLRRLDDALDGLPAADAPDALVDGTLRAVRQAAAKDGAGAKPRPWQRGLAAGLAASVVIAAGVGITMSLHEPAYKLVAVDRDDLALGPETEAEELPSSSLRKSEVQAQPAPAQDISESFELAQNKPQEGAYRTGHERNEAIGRELDVIAQLEARRAQEPPAVLGAKSKADHRLDEAAAAKELVLQGEIQSPVGGVASNLPEVADAEVSFADDKALHGQSRDAGRPAEEYLEGDGDREIAETKRRNRALSPAAGFLARYGALEGLTFQAPTGYWANSYIPGDRVMRLLEARLGDWDRGALGRDFRLEQDIVPIAQPFDGPRGDALALYLTSDATAVEGPTRLRLQVGLKGAERQGGHRPDMNIGLVIDLRAPLDLEAATRVRALIEALQRARQPGDRFSLTVAGPGGGLLVAPEDFRHGPLSIALERMFAGELAGEALALPVAMELATESVLAGDDPNGVLGSSLVLLVTGASLAGNIDRLETMAHRNAVGGVPTSVVSLAGRDDLSQIDRLVAAGQGHRRVLDSAQAAEGLVDQELHAASRAVARALRLRIRLAPGVKLVDVLGSQPLGAPQAEQVREAEQAIDKRLARTLGIAADRGEDEEGIQIVIPNFYAGDEHVILLDLVAERPGPIAEVTLRYKDVVNLENGVAQASLSLGSGARATGPLELNVLKNLTAHRFAQDARRAGRALAAGDAPQAAQILASLRDMLRGLRQEVPAWRTDPDLTADEALLNDYLALLASPVVGDGVQRRNLADSLQVAAFRKLHPPAH